MQHQVQGSGLVPMGHMPQYGVEHWSYLTLTLLCAVVAVPLVRRHPRVVRPAGWVFLALTVFWMGWGFLPANFSLEQSLPFHFSDLLRVITAIALITRSRWAVSVTIFWGLTLNLMSLLSPDLHYDAVPWLESFFYWFLHIWIMVAALVFIFSLRCRPGTMDITITLCITIGWGIICLVVNHFTGANYGYLSHEPAVDSILGVLGPWPLYILAELFLLGVAWAVLSYFFSRMKTPYASNTRNVIANSTAGSARNSAP